MAHPIVMPSFGMYTSEGKLVGWIGAQGEPVTQGQTIAEIETEKAVQDLVCPAAGILHHVATIGTMLKEEDIIGYVLEPGEPPPETPGPDRAPAGTTTPTAAGRATTPGAPMVKASPIAKRLAAEHGLNLNDLSGSGPGGRVVEADIRAAIENRPLAVTGTGVAQLSRTPLPPMRRAIGERLRHSIKQTVALTLMREVEAEHLVAARHAASADRESVSYDAYFAKMLAVALRDFPQLNSTIEGDDLIVWKDVNVGVAVSLPAGLVVPVVAHADRLSLLEISSQIRGLATRARESGLRPDEMANGTCTITNLGAAQVDGFTPVLNPPQSCILGIGRIRPRAIVRDGQLAVANTCMLSLTFDHRVTDGQPAAQVIETVAKLMNDASWLAQLSEEQP